MIDESAKRASLSLKPKSFAPKKKTDSMHYPACKSLYEKPLLYKNQDAPQSQVRVPKKDEWIVKHNEVKRSHCVVKWSIEP